MEGETDAQPPEKPSVWTPAESVPVINLSVLSKKPSPAPASPNEFRGFNPKRLPKLPGSDPTLSPAQLFHMATNANPKVGEQLLCDTSVRRRHCSPFLSVQKKQNHRLLGSAETLDTWGFVRGDSINPKVEAERAMGKIKRDEPHYWQTKKVVPPKVTGLFKAVKAPEEPKDAPALDE
eukprot:1178058-Prorocentrum_minimum.AAC.1